MGAPLVFVDTNVFIYSVDERFTEKQAAAKAWLDKLWRTGSGRTSAQVLNELYVNLSRKVRLPVPRSEARKLVRSLDLWQPVPLQAALTARAWAVEDRYGFSWWDSLIVAAAQVAACDLLLTEDLQHHQDLDGLLVVDPVQVPPSAFFG